VQRRHRGHFLPRILPRAARHGVTVNGERRRTQGGPDDVAGYGRGMGTEVPVTGILAVKVVGSLDEAMRTSRHTPRPHRGDRDRGPDIARRFTAQVVRPPSWSTRRRRHRAAGVEAWAGDRHLRPRNLNALRPNGPCRAGRSSKWLVGETATSPGILRSLLRVRAVPDERRCAWSRRSSGGGMPRPPSPPAVRRRALFIERGFDRTSP